MPSYSDYYFCRNCSGNGHHGKRVWIKKQLVTTNPPRCPYCGKYLRTTPSSGMFRNYYDFEGEFQVLAFRGALKTIAK